MGVGGQECSVFAFDQENGNKALGSTKNTEWLYSCTNRPNQESSMPKPRFDRSDTTQQLCMGIGLVTLTIEY